MNKKSPTGIKPKRQNRKEELGTVFSPLLVTLLNTPDFFIIVCLVACFLGMITTLVTIQRSKIEIKNLIKEDRKEIPLAWSCWQNILKIDWQKGNGS
jgi:hypothetical protein